ncbi:MAG TPA: aspartate ammonia-lyase [Blastocatellia bacterium]|nr:aspartate ammonia-lyase [Blastocatellia bacterium]
MNNSEPQFRLESDPLGEVRVPSHAMYGVQTRRALENFQISRLRAHPLLITAFVEIKKAAAEANLQTGTLDPDIAEVIIRAADELLAGSWHDQFDLDVFQAGAGTSYNMNVNEVIANRALEMLGRRRGEYERLNPNDHVNKAQSTNDTMPTAMRTAAVRLLRRLLVALDELTASLTAKADEFADVVKSGRTHLHDATAMTLGQEFGGYADNVARAAERLRAAEAPLLEIPLGGTAVGTGVNTHPDYARVATARLGEITGLALREARNRFQSMQSLGDFVALSGALRSLAIELSKIANDLRLLSSGPHTGLDEIELPAVQPGSSIMPGKVNPTIPEMLNMVCFHVIGHDTAIALCGEAGQLELNVMMPYVAYALLESLEVMTNAARTFDEKCVRGTSAHRERCREFAERSVGQAALLNERLGFMGAAKLAQRAMAAGKSVQELLDEDRKFPGPEESGGTTGTSR